MALRGKLQRIVDTLVDEHKDQGGVPLDALGDAIATEAVTTVEIDEMMSGIESAGLQVTSPKMENGEVTLKHVLDAARALSLETGERPTAAAIAAHAGIALVDVHHALALAKVMQR
jgi:hypothetical protein